MSLYNFWRKLLAAGKDVEVGLARATKFPESRSQLWTSLGSGGRSLSCLLSPALCSGEAEEDRASHLFPILPGGIYTLAPQKQPDFPENFSQELSSIEMLVGWETHEVSFPS